MKREGIFFYYSHEVGWDVRANLPAPRLIPTNPEVNDQESQPAVTININNYGARI
jgi:hypothetical protein